MPVEISCVGRDEQVRVIRTKNGVAVHHVREVPSLLFPTIGKAVVDLLASSQCGTLTVYPSSLFVRLLANESPREALQRMQDIAQRTVPEGWAAELVATLGDVLRMREGAGNTFPMICTYWEDSTEEQDNAC